MTVRVAGGGWRAVIQGIRLLEGDKADAIVIPIEAG